MAIQKYDLIAMYEYTVSKSNKHNLMNYSLHCKLGVILIRLVAARIHIAI